MKVWLVDMLCIFYRILSFDWQVGLSYEIWSKETLVTLLPCLTLLLVDANPFLRGTIAKELSFDLCLIFFSSLILGETEF